MVALVIEERGGCVIDDIVGHTRRAVKAADDAEQKSTYTACETPRLLQSEHMFCKCAVM